MDHMQTLKLHSIKYFNSFISVTFYFLMSCTQGCVGKKKSSTASGRNIGAVIGADESKARVSPEELDGPSMRIEKFEVTYAETGKTKIPLLSYSIPQKADFVQIIRCDANLKTSLPEEPDSAVQDTASGAKTVPRNTVWNEISSTLGCLQISTGVSRDQHPDYFASSGNWIYFSRACINPARLPNIVAQSEVEPCSRHVSRTSILSGYVNQQADLPVEKQTEMMLLRDRVDETGRNIFFKLRRLKTELLFCDAEKGVNFLSIKRRDSAEKILNFGIVLGVSLIDQPPLPAIHPKEQISATLRDLDAGSEEFLPANFCVSAEQTRKDIESERLQLEADAAAFNKNITQIGQPSALNSITGDEKSSPLGK